jgi:predicted alpha/beta superfamily hydrolase
MVKLSLYSLFLMLITFSACSGNSQPTDPIPAHETYTLKSKHLGEDRIINVWTPKGYLRTSESLTVLYMPDGGIKEDFPHIANTLNDLIKANKIAPVILVGIENTQRRRDLTGPTTVAKDKEIAPIVSGSAAFRDFISDELVTFINQKYRTARTKGIIGESLAGLFVTETFFLQPQLFDFYIAFDPSLWWNNQHLLKTADQYLDKFDQSKKTFWFAGSSATDISTNVSQLADILTQRKSPNIIWKYANEKKEKHNTIFRATKEKALIWTLNNL